MNNGISLEALLRLVARLTETAGKLNGIRLEFPQAIRDGQTAWPEDCPLSETEMRGEIEGIVDDLAALETRIRELNRRLPAPPEEESGARPFSIYYALTDGVSLLEDDPGALGYVRERLAATPESLRSEWLKYQLMDCLEVMSDTDTKKQLEKLARLLCGEAEDAADDS